MAVVVTPPLSFHVPCLLASLAVLTPQQGFLEPVEDAFTGGSDGATTHAFTVVAADMDEDGDEDVLVNWHLHRPIELFENVGGAFRLIEIERSGLDDNAGVPSLFTATESQLERIANLAGDGIWIWHDEDRKDGRWHLAVRRARGSPVDLHVVASAPIRGIAGLVPGEFRRRGLNGLELSLPETAYDVHLDFRVEGTASQVRLLPAPREGTLPAVHAGSAGGAPVDPASLSFWKPDPHGIAWVDLGGTPAPELYVGRGALAGRLDERTPKRNRFYRATPAGARLFELDATSFPPELGRARQVQWVDARGSRQLELYVGNRDSPNALYFWSMEGKSWVNRAPAFELAFEDGESFAWLDVDQDGSDELIVLDRARLRVFARGPELAYVESPDHIPHEELPNVTEAEPFHTAALHVLDVDGNGALDLWLTGLGPAREQRLFARTGRRFEDRTAAFGLAELVGAHTVVTFDVDSDGDEDAVALGERTVLAVNERGRFSLHPFETSDLDDSDPVREEGAADDDSTSARVACPVDADGDGRTDLVLVGEAPTLWRNVSTGPDPLTVVVAGSPAAIGAVVTAVHASGHRQARRLGSAQNPPFSQSVRPLSFGEPESDPILRVRVRWPGGGQTVHPVQPGERRLDVSR